MTDAIFQALLTATWQSMLLAMLVLLIMLLFQERLAPRFRYLLWCIVLFRLAMPILPATPWGVLPNHNPVVVNQSRDHEGAVAPRETQSLERESQPYTVTPIVPHVIEVPVIQKAATINRDHVFAYAKQIILAVWVAGTLVLGIRYVLDEIRLSRQSRYWKPVEDENLLAVFESCRRQLGIRRRVRLFAVSHGIGAATTGTFFPKVLLSEQAVLNPDVKQLRLVILHELVHLKRFDPLVLRLSVLLSVLHWLNPAVWLAMSRLQRDRELACDAAVLHILGSHDPTGTTQKDYGEAVLTFATLFSPREHLPGLVGLFPKHAIARRIEMILTHKKSNFFYAVFGVLLVLTVAAFGLTRAADTTNEEIKPPVVKQEEGQTLITTEGEPLLKEPSYQSMITGRVSMPDGTPAKRVSIKYRSVNVKLSKEGDKVLGSGSMIVETSTDENGKYYTKCPSSGDFRQISAVGQAYMKDEQDNAATLISEPVVVDFGKETQEVNFTLRNGVSVTGTVRYPDGTPAKERQVFFSRELAPIASPIVGLDPEVLRQGTVAERDATTDENGKYKIYLWPGEYKAKSHDGVGDMRTEPKTVLVESGKESIVDFTLSHTLFVRMLHADGKPVFPEGKPAFYTQKAMLYKKGNGKASVGNGIDVNSDGKIQVFPYPEKNIMVFMTEDGKEGIVCQLPWDVKNLETIDVTLKPTVQVKFQLLEKETKQPFADEKVWASLMGGIDHQGMGWAYDCETDVNGNVVIPVPALENVEGLRYKIGLECRKTTRLDTDWISPQTPGETLDFGQRYLDREKVVLADDDALVFADGKWMNEKTGEVLPSGTFVQGTQGTFRIEQENGEGKVVKLSGEGATGQGKYVKFSNGGNAIAVSELSLEVQKELKEHGIAIGPDDVFVYGNGQWTNEKTGGVIPMGNLVSGTRGLFRLEQENGEGKITLLAGSGAVGHGKYIRWSNGGNAWSGSRP